MQERQEVVPHPVPQEVETRRVPAVLVQVEAKEPVLREERQFGADAGRHALRPLLCALVFGAVHGEHGQFHAPEVLEKGLDSLGALCFGLAHQSRRHAVGPEEGCPVVWGRIRPALAG